MKRTILLLAALFMIVAASAQKEFITVPYRIKVSGEMVQAMDTIYLDQFKAYGFKLDTARVIYHKVLTKEGVIGTGRGFIIIGWTRNREKLYEKIFNEFLKPENTAYNIQLFKWK